MPGIARPDMVPTNLREWDKYSDLQIQCDGVTFYVHRFVVCRKSDVLAKECEKAVKEGDVIKVEHKNFNALTLERVLRFMYTDDYDISEPDSTGKTTKFDIAPNGAPGVSAFGRLFVHVYTYLAATHYELPDLQVLALTRFETSDETITLDEFLDISKVIYQSPESNDGLRQVLVLKLVNDYSNWLTDNRFRQALADLDNHVFMVDVWSASFDKLREKKEGLTTGVKAEHSHNLQLHSALEQMLIRQRKADSQVKQLSRKLEETELAKINLETELHSCKAWGASLSEQADKIGIDVLDRDTLLREQEKILRAEKERADRSSDLVRTKDEQIREKALKVQEEANRADENPALCVKKDEELRKKHEELRKKDEEIKTETERAKKYQEFCLKKDYDLQKETDRANKNYELCAKKDHAIKSNAVDAAMLAENKARAERGFKHFHQAQMLINHTDCCCNCGEGYEWPLLYKDESKTVYVQCRTCGDQDFAAHIN